MRSQLDAFVGRQSELTQFSEIYQQCTSGKALLSVVRGQPGAGKTSLLEAFSSKMSTLEDAPIIAMARCDSTSRAKTPYHVLGQLLPTLLESRNADKESQRDVQVGRILRVSSRLLKNFGPDLLDLVVPGASKLVSKSVKIIDQVNKEDSDNLISEVMESQEDQIDKLSGLLVELSSAQTLILIVDDAHLADPISISVLSRLLNNYPKSRVMVMLGVRPSYKKAKANEEPSSLEELLFLNKTSDCNLDDVPEFKRREFVNEVLNLVPNDLDEGFREQVFRRTDGHPLLTRELILGLASNKSIFCQKNGLWSADNDISWNQAPDNIREALIQRMETLQPEEQELLRVASAFDGEMISCIAADFLNYSDWDVLRILTRTLHNNLAILRETRAFRIGNKLVVGFRFREPMFREYVYQTLCEGERMFIHDAIASGYKAMFGEAVEHVSSELAWHLEQAGRLREALELHRKTAQAAMKVGGLAEALMHITRGINGIDGLGADKSRDELELSFLLLQSQVLKARSGWSSSTLDQINKRVGALALCCGELEQIESILMSEWSSYLARGDLKSSINTAEQLLKNAEASKELTSLILGNAVVSNSLFWLGDIVEANKHACKALSLHTPKLGEEMTAKHGFDPVVIAQMFAVWTAHILGNYDDLRKFEKLTRLTVQQGHPFSSVIAQMTLCWQASHEQDAKTTLLEAAELRNIADRGEFVSYQGLADIFMGWAKGVSSKDYMKGLTQLNEGEKIWHETSGPLISTYRALLRSHLLYGKNNIEKIGEELSAAFEFAEQTHEKAYESELWRAQGELFELISDKRAECINAYWRSVILAKNSGARTFELAALAKLLTLNGADRNRERAVLRAQELIAELKCKDEISLVGAVEKLL